MREGWETVQRCYAVVIVTSSRTFPIIGEARLPKYTKFAKRFSSRTALKARIQQRFALTAELSLLSLDYSAIKVRNFINRLLFTYN